MRVLRVLLLCWTLLAPGPVAAFATRRPWGTAHKQLRSSTTDSTVVSQSNLDLLSERGRRALENLIQSDTDRVQQHVYGDWPEPGNEDEGKRQLAEQVRITIKSIFSHLFSNTVVGRLGRVVSRRIANLSFQGACIACRIGRRYQSFCRLSSRCTGRRDCHV